MYKMCGLVRVQGQHVCRNFVQRKVYETCKMINRQLVSYLDGDAGLPPPLLRGMMSINVTKVVFNSPKNNFDAATALCKTTLLENPTSFGRQKLVPRFKIMKLTK